MLKKKKSLLSYWVVISGNRVKQLADKPTEETRDPKCVYLTVTQATWGPWSTACLPMCVLLTAQSVIIGAHESRKRSVWAGWTFISEKACKLKGEHISSWSEFKPTFSSGNQPQIFTGIWLWLKLQYFGHLMWRADSLEKDTDTGMTEGRRRGWQRMRRLDSITNSTDMNLSKLWETVKDRGTWRTAVHGVTDSRTRQRLNNNKRTLRFHER